MSMLRQNNAVIEIPQKRLVVFLNKKSLSPHVE